MKLSSSCKWQSRLCNKLPREFEEAQELSILPITNQRRTGFRNSLEDWRRRPGSGVVQRLDAAATVEWAGTRHLVIALPLLLLELLFSRLVNEVLVRRQVIYSIDEGKSGAGDARSGKVS